MADDSELVAERVDRLRTKLLDLTTNNRMLAFRHPKASCLRVVDKLLAVGTMVLSMSRLSNEIRRILSVLFGDDAIALDTDYHLRTLIEFYNMLVDYEHRRLG